MVLPLRRVTWYWNTLAVRRGSWSACEIWTLFTSNKGVSLVFGVCSFIFLLPFFPSFIFAFSYLSPLFFLSFLSFRFSPLFYFSLRRGFLRLAGLHVEFTLAYNISWSILNVLTFSKFFGIRKDWRVNFFTWRMRMSVEIWVNCTHCRTCFWTSKALETDLKQVIENIWNSYL